MQQERQTLLRTEGNQPNNLANNNIPVSLNSNQIREVRLKKQLQFLSEYDYEIISDNEGTTIVIRNLWKKNQQIDQSKHDMYQIMADKHIKVHLPKDYPFKQPSFVLNNQQTLCVSQLLDEWSPRFKVMEMIELLKKRLQQRVALEQKLANNPILAIFKAVPSLWISILVVVTLRACVGLGSYSGKGDWPNLGDFQAHRNWMSITINRPITQWYTEHSEQPWWRIDYPPIAAYLSYIFGTLYSKIQPASMMLQEGYQTPSLTAYMRFTVLLIDILFLMPAVYLVCRQCSSMRYRNKSLFYALIFIILLKPDQILIDHGHLQYNCLMLGLILYAFYFMITERRYLCCFTFTLAINCKLMSVYFSLAFLAGLIGLTYRRYGRHRKEKFIGQCIFYGIIVILTTFLLWLPWIGSMTTFTSVLQAIFPVHRGLYQLKVPNFWCISDIVMKWQSWLSKPTLTFLCFLFCILFSLPSMLALMLKPTQKVLIFGFSCISMIFFMFSYHVHQKSILVPLCIIPFISQYIGGSLVIDLVIGACVGMYHLLKQDGQKLQYFVMLILYIVLSSYFYKCQDVFMEVYHPQNRSHPSVDFIESDHPHKAQFYHKKYFGFKAPLRIIYIFGGLVFLHLGEQFLTPPQKLPYLWNLLFAFYSFVLNTYFICISHWILWQEVKSALYGQKKD